MTDDPRIPPSEDDLLPILPESDDAAAPVDEVMGEEAGIEQIPADGDDIPVDPETGEPIPQDEEGHVRAAGRGEMEMPPDEWTDEDEASDESFPASDPGAKY